MTGRQTEERTGRQKDPRLTALRRFAVSITALNVAGYVWLGFEQPWAWPFAAAATAYAAELTMETVTAWTQRRRPLYRDGGLRGLADFLLPAHITGLACNMLLYTNDWLPTTLFVVVIAIVQKSIFRAPIGGKSRHFFNPSNFGLSVALLLFPWISIAPPYEFTENVDTAARWLIPLVILASGTMLNAQLTKKTPLIAGWLGGFALQAVIRHFLFGTAWLSALAVMTGVAFLLFTNYMITDPATTPVARRAQLAFGAGVAFGYGVLMAAHVVYGLFFALTTVCLVRGGYHLTVATRATWRRTRAAQPAPQRPADAESEVVRL